eukprot:gene1515-1907_t
MKFIIYLVYFLLFNSLIKSQLIKNYFYDCYGCSEFYCRWDQSERWLNKLIPSQPNSSVSIYGYDADFTYCYLKIPQLQFYNLNINISLNTPFTFNVSNEFTITDPSTKVTIDNTDLQFNHLIIKKGGGMEVLKLKSITVSGSLLVDEGSVLRFKEYSNGTFLGESVCWSGSCQFESFSKVYFERVSFNGMVEPRGQTFPTFTMEIKGGTLNGQSYLATTKIITYISLQDHSITVSYGDFLAPIFESNGNSIVYLGQNSTFLQIGKVTNIKRLQLVGTATFLYFESNNLIYIRQSNLGSGCLLKFHDSTRVHLGTLDKTSSFGLIQVSGYTTLEIYGLVEGNIQVQNQTKLENNPTRRVPTTFIVPRQSELKGELIQRHGALAIYRGDPSDVDYTGIGNGSFRLESLEQSESSITYFYLIQDDGIDNNGVSDKPFIISNKKTKVSGTFNFMFNVSNVFKSDGDWKRTSKTFTLVHSVHTKLEYSHLTIFLYDISNSSINRFNDSSAKLLRNDTSIILIIGKDDSEFAKWKIALIVIFSVIDDGPRNLTDYLKFSSNNIVSDMTTYFKYISEKGIANLAHYSYSGVDNSFCGKHFLKHWWNYAVEYTPLWLAPNVITLAGLFCNIGMYLIMYFYCPTLTEAAPRWAYFVIAFLIFAYQTLDNVDGKQARKTKTSSPLGELFDHCCDALSVAMFAVVMAATLRIGYKWAFISFIVGIWPFYMAHWEEYHAGILVLGEFNGPTEAQVLFIIIELLTGIFSSDIWTIGPPYATIGIIATIAVMIGAILTVSQKISFSRCLMQLTPFLVFNVLIVIWASVSPMLQERPHLFIMTVGLLFSYIQSRYITQRVCHDDCLLFYPILIPIGLATFNSILAHSGHPIFSELAVLWMMFITACIQYCLFAYFTTLQLCEHLNIRVFVIPYPSPLNNINNEQNTSLLLDMQSDPNSSKLEQDINHQTNEDDFI